MARHPAFQPTVSKGLSDFVYFLAVPALLFSLTAKGLPWAQVEWGITVSYFAVCYLLFIVSCLFSFKVFGLSLAQQALFGMAGVFGNTVLMGIPLIMSAFGEAGVLPLAMIISFHSIFLLPLVIVMAEVAREGGVDLRRIPKLLIQTICLNPIIMALVFGTLWGLTEVGVPTGVTKLLELLGAAAAPCALFALGASLVQLKLAGDISESITVAIIKLAVMPLSVWMVGGYVFELPQLWLAVAVVMAALPSGTMVFLTAQRYDLFVQRAASTVLISTLASVVTLTLVLWLVLPVNHQ